MWNQKFNIKYYFCSSTIDNKHLNPKLNKHFIFNLSQSFSIITSTVKPTLKDKLWRHKNLKTNRFLSSLNASCAIYVIINGKNEGRNYQISLCLKNHFILVRINLFGTFLKKSSNPPCTSSKVFFDTLKILFENFLFLAFKLIFAFVSQTKKLRQNVSRCVSYYPFWSTDFRNAKFVKTSSKFSKL